MPGQHVLITGGAGFVGGHLAERLLADGDRVTCLDLLDPYYDPALKRANVARCAGRAGYQFVEGDVTVPSDMAKLGTQPFDAIFHLAARVGVRASVTDPGAYVHHNILGTQRMLEFARTMLKGPFLFASSSSVYGDRTDGPFKETDRTDQPETIYAASKKAGELEAYAYHKLHGLRCICLRFFTVYGPRQRPEMAIAKFAHLIQTGQPLPLLGDLNSARDYTFVADTCDGLVRAMRSDIQFGIYNLGCGQPVTLGEMVDALGRALKQTPRIEQLPRASGDVFLTFADISHAREDFQYQPKVPFAEGIARYVASLPGAL